MYLNIVLNAKAGLFCQLLFFKVQGAIEKNCIRRFELKCFHILKGHFWELVIDFLTRWDHPFCNTVLKKENKLTEIHFLKCPLI